MCVFVTYFRWYNLHLLTLTVEGPQNILFPEDTVNQYFIINQESKKWQKSEMYRNLYT